MNCRELTDFLDDYLDGSMPEWDRAAFEEHLAECPACVKYLDSYRQTVRLCRRQAMAEAAPDLIIRAILASRQPV